MKTLLASFLFAPAMTGTCPQLAGIYTCVGSENKPYKLEVAQEVRSETTIYTIDDGVTVLPVPANSLRYSAVNKETQLLTSFISGCKGKIFAMHTREEAVDPAAALKNFVQIDDEYVLNEKGELVITSKLAAMVAGKVQDLPRQTTTCTPVK